MASTMWVLRIQRGTDTGPAFQEWAVEDAEPRGKNQEPAVRKAAALSLAVCHL